MAREDEIRLIAYSIWEEESCPIGRECEHWYRAEIIWEQRQKPVKISETKAEQPQEAKRVVPMPIAARKNTHKTPKK